MLSSSPLSTNSLALFPFDKQPVTSLMSLFDLATADVLKTASATHSNSQLGDLIFHSSIKETCRFNRSRVNQSGCELENTEHSVYGGRQASKGAVTAFSLQVFLTAAVCFE